MMTAQRGPEQQAKIYSGEWRRPSNNFAVRKASTTEHREVNNVKSMDALQERGTASTRRDDWQQPAYRGRNNNNNNSSLYWGSPERVEDLETLISRIRFELSNEKDSATMQAKGVKAAYTMNKLKKLHADSKSINTAIMLLSRVVAVALDRARTEETVSQITGMQISIALNAVSGRDGCDCLLSSASQTLQVRTMKSVFTTI
jgi:hypothetical protein